MQEPEHARQHLATAYARLIAAQHRLERGRWEALFGTQYDPDVYDAQILEWRSAQRALTAAVGIQRRSQ
jgi:hypothetical protein